MNTYEARHGPGATVRIASRPALDEFKRTWSYHNPLAEDQLQFADRLAIVREVGFYHGGDALYSLVDVPGVWHEACLRAADGPGD